MRGGLFSWVRLTMTKTRQIKHTSIRKGDVIRVTHYVEDVKLSSVGTVRQLETSSQGLTEYRSGLGVVLFSVNAAGKTSFKGAIISLLNRIPDPTLF